MKYESFIEAKRLVAPPVGIPDPPELSRKLFPFQSDITRWAIRRGRAAIWADCGLGKSWMALEWARVVHEHTGGNVLILTPLAVAQQFVREGEKLGVRVKHARMAEDTEPGINVTNYDRLHHFDPASFAGIVADESSILKDYTSATRNALIEAFAATPFRLACTATPAPNDHMELGNHAEFLGVMTRTEMLAMFFTHDGGETQTWRLKGHAQDAFWRWVASWAVNIRKPSDLGYDDAGFILPPLTVHERVMACGDDMARRQGALFTVEARTLEEQRSARKASLPERVAEAARIILSEPDEHWLVWVDLNAEGEAIAAAVDGAVEVAGSHSTEWKEAAIEWFAQDRCVCGRPEIETHIQPWLQRNSELISASTTGKTVNGDSRNQKSTSGNTATRRSNTSPSTIEQTRNDTSAHPSSANASTPDDESATPRTPRSANARSRRSRTGRDATPTSASRSDCESTESHSMSTQSSLSHRAEGVPCADAPSHRTPTTEAESDGGYTSTTATRPAASEDYCAHLAISDSESSGTTRPESSAPPCTCESIKGRVLVSKSSILGWGVNMQVCARVVFVGLSHSFEAWYQAIRRTYRFGQTRPVECYVVTSDAEGRVVANLKRKQADAEAMSSGMVAHMADITRAELKATARDATEYKPKVRMVVPAWVGREETAA